MVGHVEWEAEPADLGADLLGGLAVQVADGYPGSLARQRQGGGAADAAAAAGDGNDLSGERAGFLGHVDNLSHALSPPSRSRRGGVQR